MLPFAIALFLATGIQADLVFDQQPLELKPKPEDETVDFEFTFTNKGSKPIKVTGLDSSCVCLEASLDKAAYAPGEKGKGKATFVVTSLVGRQEKTLHLLTNDPKAPDHVLTVVVDVPEVVSIEPKLLEWVVGEEPKAKEMTMKILGDEPMNIKKVTASRENVTFDVKEVKAGREYRITIKPQSTTEVTVGLLSIQTDSKIPKFARQMAFFNIVRPELAEKKARAKEARAAEASKTGEN